MKYDAFISYSHAVDGKLAPALQQTMHRLAKPWYRRKMLSLFRDETNLSATPHLWDTIEKALEDSEHLILLASPEAAQSKWVEKELGYWLEHKSIDTLLIGLTDGEIVWDNKATDFDWTKTNALPKLLKSQFRQEPLYVDLRSIKTKKALSIGNPAFKQKAAVLAATLHKKPVEDLIGQDIEEFRRNLRIRNGVILLLSLLLLISMIASWWAFDRTAYAENRQAFAEVQQQIAQDSAREAQRQRAQAEISAKMARDSAFYARTQEAFAREQQKNAESQRNLAIQAQKNEGIQRRLAEIQRDSARLERDIAEANRLAAIANNIKERDPNLAIRIAEKSYEQVYPPVPDAAQAISAAYFEYFDSKIIPYEAEINFEESYIEKFRLFANGTRVLYDASGGILYLYDIPSEEKKEIAKNYGSYILSEDPGFILTHPYWNPGQNKPAKIWGFNGELIQEINIKGKIIKEVFHLSDSNQLLFLTEENDLYMATPPYCKDLRLIAQTDHVYQICDDPNTLDCLTTRGKFYFTRSKRELQVWDVSGKKLKTIRGYDQESPGLSAVSFDENHIAITRGHRLEVFGLNDDHHAVLEQSTIVDFDYWDFSFSQKGKYIIGVNKVLVKRDYFNQTRTWLNIKVWNLAGKLIKDIRYDVAMDQRVVTSPNDKYLLVQTTNGYSQKAEGNNQSYSPWDNEYIAIYEIEGNNEPIKTISAFNLDYATPKAAFLNEEEIIFMGSEKRLEILNFLNNSLKNNLVHEKYISDLEIDFSSQTLISKDAENIKFWNFNGDLLLHIQGDQGSRANYSISGDYLLTHANTTKLWHMNTQIARELQHPGRLEGITFSEDSLRFISYGTDNARIWDQEGNIIGDISTDHSIEGASFLPGEYRFVFWGAYNITLHHEDGTILKTKDLNDEGLDVYGISNLAFSKDKKWFITSDGLGRILVWNTPTFNFFDGYQISNGNFISRATGTDAYVIGPTLFKNIAMPLDTINLTMNYGQWNAVDFQEKLKRFIFPDRHKALLFNYEGKRLSQLSPHDNLVIGALFNPLNPSQVLTYTQKDLHLWDIPSGKRLLKIDATKYERLSTVLWGANGNIIALTQSKQAPLVIWDNKGRIVKEDNSHRGFIKHLTLSPDKKTFITCSGRAPMEPESGLPSMRDQNLTDDIDYTVKIWSVEGQLLADFDKNVDEVMVIGFYKNSDWIYIGTSDGKIKIFPVPQKIYQWLKSESTVPFLSEEEKRRFNIRE